MTLLMRINHFTGSLYQSMARQQYLEISFLTPQQPPLQTLRSLLLLVMRTSKVCRLPLLAYLWNSSYWESTSLKSMKVFILQRVMKVDSRRFSKNNILELFQHPRLTISCIIKNIRIEQCPLSLCKLIQMVRPGLKKLRNLQVLLRKLVKMLLLYFRR